MFLILLSLVLCALYFALEQYSFGLIINTYEIHFNPAIGITALMVLFLSGAVIMAQFYSIKGWFYHLKYRRLERRLRLQEEKNDFERDATGFLFKVHEIDDKWHSYLQDSFYRPKTSFKKDIELWQGYICEENYTPAYNLIKNAEPYLPPQYIEIWLFKTIKMHLKSVSEEKDLRRLLRKVPEIFYVNQDFLELLSIKLALFTNKKEILAHIGKMKPEYIDDNCQNALWYWMRHDSAFWFNHLTHLWHRKNFLSSSASVLMVKLAISTDFIGQARTYLEYITLPSERFYLEHLLSLHADRRMALLVGGESEKDSDLL